MTKVHFHKPEPDPIVRDLPFEESVQGKLCEYVEHHGLAQAIKARAEEGKEKYGTYLFTHDGRSTKMDAAQEALDFLVYLYKMVLEGSGKAQLLLPEAIERARFMVEWCRDD